MSHMVLWLVVAAVMALIEAFSFGLITMWFVVGALVAFVADLLGASFVVQIVLFLVVSGRAFRPHDLVGSLRYGGGPSCGHARRGRCPGVYQAHCQTV